MSKRRGRLSIPITGRRSSCWAIRIETGLSDEEATLIRFSGGAIMRPRIKVKRLGLIWLICGLMLLGAYEWAGGQARSGASPDREKDPPWKRVLKGEDAEKAEQLAKKID